MPSTDLVSSHYDAGYFKWQDSIGDFGAWANVTKFRQHVKASDTVLDFGCGNGAMLKNLPCAVRIGIEPSSSASAKAKDNGLTVYSKTSDVPSSSVDVAISNHALEHCLHPLTELQELYRILKPGGRLVIVIPCETAQMAYKPGDINHHLFSWGPMTLGNVLGEAGFMVHESKAYWSLWPPGYRKIAKLVGRTGFDVACWIYSKINRRTTQVRAIAVKS